MKLPGAPEANNNKFLIIPQWDMVILRMREDRHPYDKDIVYGTFHKMMGEAIQN